MNSDRHFVRPRGIGGEATKSKTKGGGATPHACPLLNPAPKLQTRKTQKEILKRNKMQKILIHISRKFPLKIHILTLLVTTTTQITSCQTTEATQKKEITHVLAEQETLIDALMAERSQDKVKVPINKNPTLATAETHLDAALNALKQSSQALKEATNNEQH